MCDDDVTGSRDASETLTADNSVTHEPFGIQDDKGISPMDSLPSTASQQSNLQSKTTMKSSGHQVQALPMDIDEEIDVHTCASCKVLFTSLEDYIGHKIGSAKCGKNLNSKKMQLMKQLVATPSGRGRKRGRPPLSGRIRQQHNSPLKQSVAKQMSSVKGVHEDGKYDRLKLHHKQSDIISDHSGYKCRQCGRSFRRQAALNRHSQFDHREKGSDDSELDDGDDSGEYKNDVADTQNESNEEQTLSSSPGNDGSHEVLNICVNTSNSTVPTTIPGSPKTDNETHYVTVMEETEPGSGVLQETYKMQLDNAEYLIVPQTLNVEQTANVELQDETLGDVACTYTEVGDTSSTSESHGTNQRDHPVETDTTESRHQDKTKLQEAAQTVSLEQQNTRGVKKAEFHPNDDCEPPEIIVMPRLRIQPEKMRVGASQCAKCSHWFKDRFVLRAHMLTHSNIKAYHCTFDGCLYSSKTKGSLQRHARRHTGERPFKCKLCGRAFRESGCLARHRKARGLCSSRSDSEFPRYKKNLRFDYTKNVSHSNEGSEQAPKHANEEQTEFVRFVNKGSAQTIGHFVPNTENSVIDAISGFTAEEVVLIPVVPSQAAAIKEISDNSVYGDMARSDDVTGDVPVSPRQSHSPEVLLTVVSEEDLQAHQGLSLEIGAETCDDDSYMVDMGKYDGDTSYEMTDHADRPTSPDATVMTSAEISSSSMDSNKVPVFLVKEEKETFQNNSDQLSQTLTCVVDQQKFNSKESLVLHLKTHMIMCKFRCDRCTYMTDDRAKMEDHIQITHLKQWIGKNTPLSGEPQSPVDEISIEDSEPAATSETRLIAEPTQQAHHDRSKHGTSQHHGSFFSVREAHLALDQLQGLLGTEAGGGPNSVCPVCSKTFKAAATVKQHILSHTGEKQHRCNKCDKSFYTKDALNKHMIAHSLERNYKCGECGKLFKRISHVREHLKVHSNERPYPCRICFRLFKSVNACKVHMRTHSDHLEQECPNCHKHFREKGALDRHIRTHTGEKPFACQHCNRTFAEQGTLNRHLKAKVPCTKELFDIRASQKTSADTADFPSQAVTVIDDHKPVSNVHIDTPSEDMKAVRIDHTMANNTKFVQINVEPTVKTEEENVLTEFSSVVDTQEYIVEQHRQMDDEYSAVSGTQLVQLIPSQAITTQGDVPAASPTDAVHYQTLVPQEPADNIQYIYMDNVDSENIIFIDENTGEQLELVTPSHAVPDVVGESLELVTPCDEVVSGTEPIMDNLSESIHGAVSSTLPIETEHIVTVNAEGMSEEAFRQELLSEDIVIEPGMAMEVSISDNT